MPEAIYLLFFKPADDLVCDGKIAQSQADQLQGKDPCETLSGFNPFGLAGTISGEIVLIGSLLIAVLAAAIVWSQEAESKS